MLKILHRIIGITGKYKLRIRASYITSFFKGIMMKAPLIICFLAISFFMDNKMDTKKCLYLGIAMVLSVVLEAVLEHVTNVLQSAAGYKVFADLRLRLGDHLRKLPMGYFTEGNMAAFVVESAPSAAGDIDWSCFCRTSGCGNGKDPGCG